MVFNSLEFVAFFGVVYVLYRVLPHRPQNLLLLAASYVFYAAWDWRFLGLLIASTVVDFSVARYLDRAADRWRRRRALVLSLVFNLGMLGFFKYFDFFEMSLARLVGTLGWRTNPYALRVVLPIGISFYTFMTISYVIDVYRREIKPTRNLLNFAVFVAYFPHLVAGPIMRASTLLPQIERPRSISSQQITDGLWLIAWGYFLKMFVADNLAPLVESVFGATLRPTGLDVLLASYAFAFQVFGDFAGYSNIARGVSKLMGIELNVNFLFPYFVTSPWEFWRAWHISLSSWLRDYLYIPLGGNRGSRLSTARNVMITMALGGLWHGAAWTFVLWGVYQGVVLIVARAIAEWSRRRGLSLSPGMSWSRIGVGILMFQVTCYGWLIFRARSFGQVAEFTHALLTNFRQSALTISGLVVPFALIVSPFLAVHIFQARRGTELAPTMLPLVARYVVYAGVFYLVLLWGDFKGAEFIYFQF